MSHDDTAAHLAGGLPEFFPSDSSSGNYNLVKPIADELDGIENATGAVDSAANVQEDVKPNLTVAAGNTYTIAAGDTEEYGQVTIEGTLEVNGALNCRAIDNQGKVVVSGSLSVDDEFAIERLAELGKLIETPPRENETYDHYKARLIVEYAKLTGEATISDLLTAAAEMMALDSQTPLGYTEPAGNERGTARLNIPQRGIDNTTLSGSEVATLLEKLVPISYRLESVVLGTFTYITEADYNNNNHDSSKGYNGLDNNGDPKDNGGTYAGFL